MKDMKQESSEPLFALCVKNEDYPISLEIGKIYRVVPDTEAEEHDLLRIIDESGEDYLYPAEYFVPVELPEAATKLLFAQGD